MHHSMGTISRLAVWFLSASALLLAGCATAPSGEDRGAIRSVLVVSVVGDQVFQQHVGATVFGNERLGPTSFDWALDRKFEEQIARWLEEGGRRAVLASDNQRHELRVANPGPYKTRYMLFSESAAGLEEAGRRAAKLGAAVGTDAVLLLIREMTRDDIGSTNQFVYGAGTYTRSIPCCGPAQSGAYLMSWAYLFRAGDGALLGAMRGDVLSPDVRVKDVLMMRQIRRTPFSELPFELCRKPADTWSETERTQVLERLETLLDGTFIQAWAQRGFPSRFDLIPRIETERVDR